MTHALSVADGSSSSRMADAGAVWLQKLPNAVLMTAAFLQAPTFANAQQSDPALQAATGPTAQPAPATKTTLDPADITTKANGQIELIVARDSPIFAEFQSSPALTQRLRESLQARGFELAPDAGSSKAALQFRGDIALMGGPKFFKGVKAPIGETTEKALKLARENGQMTTADVVQTTTGTALNAAAYNASLNNFTRGLAISGMANALARRRDRPAQLVQHGCCRRSTRHLPEQMRGLEQGQPDGVPVGDAGFAGRRTEGSPHPVEGFQRNGRARPGDRLRGRQGHRTHPDRAGCSREQVMSAAFQPPSIKLSVDLA